MRKNKDERRGEKVALGGKKEKRGGGNYLVVFLFFFLGECFFCVLVGRGV